MHPSDASLRAWLQAMPKAELHLHLDGSLRPATALELARERRLDDLPADEAAMRDRLVAPRRCADQAELLRAFDLPIALLQDAAALERTSAELVEDVAAEGTVYAEIRWAPSLHLERGLPTDEGIAAVVRGGTRAAAAAGIHVRFISVALRTHEPAMAIEVARAAAAYLHQGLTGFDIAGVERDAPDPRIFSQALEVARRAGLGITCHAGEWGGAQQVWQALEIDPWRIAHGAPAADDRQLMRELTERDVGLDICPTSNLLLGVVADFEQHPAHQLIDAGVTWSLNTDDPGWFDTDLMTELAIGTDAFGLTPTDHLRLQRDALRASFAPPAVKFRIGAELDDAAVAVG